MRTTAYDGWGLIAIPVDAEESSDPIGAYTIVLHPDADSDGDAIAGGD